MKSSLKTTTTNDQSFETAKPTQNSTGIKYPALNQGVLKDQKKQPQVEYISLETLMFGPNPPPINPDTLVLQNHDTTKCSVRRNGVIRAYGANTNQGIIRDYNEDRV